MSDVNFILLLAVLILILALYCFRQWSKACTKSMVLVRFLFCSLDLLCKMGKLNVKDYLKFSGMCLKIPAKIPEEVLKLMEEK